MEIATLILNFLQPILLKCWDRTSSENPQEFLKENYNAATGRMDRDVVMDALPSTRRAVRKAYRAASKDQRKNFPRYTREDLIQLTEQQLIESMNAPPEQVKAVREAADCLFEVED